MFNRVLVYTAICKPGSGAEPGEAPPRLQGPRAAGRSLRVARGTLRPGLSVSATHLSRTLADPHRLTSGQHRGAELWVGGECGSGVTPFTRGGARQSRRGAGQPEPRGGPAGLLRGTGLGGRALTRGIWQAVHAGRGTGGAALGGARGAGARERRLQRGHAPGPQLPPGLRENARVLRRIQALLTPGQAVGPGPDGEMPSAYFKDLFLR